MKETVGPGAGMSVWQLLRADVEATTHENFRAYSPAYFWGRAVVKAVVSPNVRAVFHYRIARALLGTPLAPVAWLLRARSMKVAGAEINPLATIGPGLYVVHSIGVGVGAYVTIGRNCRLHLGSVIGPQAHDGPPRHTVIGDDVFVGTHAVVAAGVTVGDGAVIGANALVVRDVAPRTVVSASPARVVGSTLERVASGPED